jgi:hypothetical protein
LLRVRLPSVPSLHPRHRRLGLHSFQAVP